MPSSSQPGSFSFQRGELLDGRFEVLDAIGRGGMARVYRAVDRHTGGRVALKVLRPELSAAPGAAARLAREAAILQRLAHPAIVALRGTGQLPAGGIYLAMELLEGHTLGQWLRRRKRLGPGELAPIVAAVCAGLHAAHREGIVHRDLKPDNIFVCSLDGQVKLLDFGVSKLFGDDVLTRPGELLGTPRYMAPEQLRAGTQAGYRADIYALGVICYEALAGRPPFLSANSAELIKAVLAGDAAPLSSVRPDTPPALSATVMRALSLQPEARFTTATEFGDAFLGALPASEPSDAVTAPLGRWPTPAASSGKAEPPAAEGPRFSEGRGSSLPAEPPSWMPQEPMRLSPAPQAPRASQASAVRSNQQDEPVELPLRGRPSWMWLLPLGLVVLLLVWVLR